MQQYLNKFFKNWLATKIFLNQKIRSYTKQYQHFQRVTTKYYRLFSQILYQTTLLFLFHWSEILQMDTVKVFTLFYYNCNQAPISKSFSEIYYQTNLSFPEIWPKKEFLFKFCSKHNTHFFKPENRCEIHWKLLLTRHFNIMPRTVSCKSTI